MQPRKGHQHAQNLTRRPNGAKRDPMALQLPPLKDSEFQDGALYLTPTQDKQLEQERKEGREGTGWSVCSSPSRSVPSRVGLRPGHLANTPKGRPGGLRYEGPGREGEMVQDQTRVQDQRCTRAPGPGAGGAERRPPLSCQACLLTWG